MGNKANPEKEIKMKIGISFRQILELVKQLPDEQQMQLWNILKKELENKGLVKWAAHDEGQLNYLLSLNTPHEGYQKPLVDKEKIKKWKEEESDEEEVEMNDEEFYKAANEI